MLDLQLSPVISRPGSGGRETEIALPPVQAKERFMPQSPIDLVVLDAAQRAIEAFEATTRRAKLLAGTELLVRHSRNMIAESLAMLEQIYKRDILRQYPRAASILADHPPVCPVKHDVSSKGT
jgi:hypothetical protein